MLKTAFASIALLVLLGACGTSQGPARFEVPQATDAAVVRVRARTVEVREVSLPLYAELEEIHIEDAEGALRSSPDVLWADTPTRSITQGLVNALSETTSATVAAEPWPFDGYPDSRVVVRFETVLAQADGMFHIAGQYFVARLSSGGRDISKRFDLSVPYDALDLTSIPRAQAEALAKLANMIATQGL